MANERNRNRERDRSVSIMDMPTPPSPPDEFLPTPSEGKADEVKDSDGGKDGGTRTKAPDPTSRERLERIRIHLGMLEKDLKDALHSGPLVGPLRQAAAKCQEQLMGNVPDWYPLKIMRTIFEMAANQLDSAPTPKKGK